GGTATNIVMETFEMHGDVRSLVTAKMDEQVKHMTEVFERTAAEFGARMEADIEFAYGPVNLSPDDTVIQRASAAIRRAGLTPSLRATGGGSDGVSPARRMAAEARWITVS